MKVSVNVGIAGCGYPLVALFTAPPRIRIPRQYEDGLIFEKDEVIRLKVSVAGRPLPRATWYHDGEPIPFGGRYEVSNTDRSSGLRISEARRADRGEYQVRATSRLGEHVVSFLVTVTGEEPGNTKLSSSRVPITLGEFAFFPLFLLSCHRLIPLSRDRTTR
jgi:hypothetical protein